MAKFLIATDLHKVHPKGTLIGVIDDAYDQSLAGGAILLIHVIGLSHAEALEIAGFVQEADANLLGFVDLDALGITEGKHEVRWNQIRSRVTRALDRL